MPDMIPVERIYSDKVTLTNGSERETVSAFTAAGDEMPAGKIPGEKAASFLGASVAPEVHPAIVEANIQDVMALLEDGTLQIWANDVLILHGPCRNYPAGGIHGAAAGGEAATEFIAANGQGLRPLRNPVPIPKNAQFTVKLIGPAAINADLDVYISLWFEIGVQAP